MLQFENDSKILTIPHHIAVIMDGNGRWAEIRGMERLKGHYQGAEALKRAVKGCIELNIKYLTVFAFSTENWQRPLEEISGLMSLLQLHLKTSLTEIQENNIRLRFIGDYQVLDPEIVFLIDQAVELTRYNTRLNLTIAFNYGGRAEIVRAAQHLIYKVNQGQLKPEDINEDVFSQELFTYDLPDPDLLIRTSSESRLSNYLLWQLAYTELVIVNTYWPDFTKDDLVYAINQYQSRERRFGQLSYQNF